jgi:hypothetical protein
LNSDQQALYYTYIPTLLHIHTCRCRRKASLMNPGEAIRRHFTTEKSTCCKMARITACRREDAQIQHTSAYVSIRIQHTSAYVSIRQHTDTAYVSIRQHTSAYVSIRIQHTSAYVSIRIQHTSAYVSLRQHTSDHCVQERGRPNWRMLTNADVCCIRMLTCADVC